MGMGREMEERGDEEGRGESGEERKGHTKKIGPKYKYKYTCKPYCCNYLKWKMKIKK